MQMGERAQIVKEDPQLLLAAEEVPYLCHSHRVDEPQHKHMVVLDF